MSSFNKVTFLFIIFFSISSCISKKKQLEAINAIKAEHEVAINQVQNNFNAASQRATELELKLAEEAGANRALAGMQTIFMNQIDSLQEEIVLLGSSAQSTQQNLDQTLRGKNQEIEELNNKIKSAAAVIGQQEESLANLAKEVADSLQSYTSEEILVDRIDGKIRIQLFQLMMFRTGKTRVRTKGIGALEKISVILNQHPELIFQVIGHHDNRSVRDYKDAWALSALRAASVIRVLTEDYDVSPNQIIASSKGAFAPKASNETKEGRASNRRIEIIIERRLKDTLREINRKLSNQ